MVFFVFQNAKLEKVQPIALNDTTFKICAFIFGTTYGYQETFWIIHQRFVFYMRKMKR